MNEGPYKTIIEEKETSRARLKTRSKLSAQEKTNLTLNSKTMNVLYNVLDVNESTQINGCKMVKEFGIS